MLRKAFGPKRGQVRGEWMKFGNEELQDLYCSLNIIQVMKQRRERWAGQVARTGRGEALIGFRRGNQKERDHLEDLSVNGRIMLESMLRGLFGRA
jgi:hypothetical protein